MVIVLSVLSGFFTGALRAQDGNPADDKVLELKREIIEIQNAGELGFRNLALCAEVKSFGSYTPLVENKVSTGSKLLLYFEPANVTTKHEGGLYSVDFKQDLVLMNESGETLFDGKDLLQFKHLTRSPALDVYATNNLNLGELPPGKYTVRLNLADNLGAKTAQTELEFEIVSES